MTAELPRLISGVPGLDRVLDGGLVEGSSYIVQGEPGAGKTVLATQIAFGQAKAGRRILYATLLAESHERLFQSLSTMDYYDAASLGDGVTFVSLFQILRSDGLEAVVGLLRKEIARQSATVLIIDGLLNARDLASNTLDVKTFVAEVQGHAAFANCTVLFLTSAASTEVSPEHTMVDGVVELVEQVIGVRSIRRLRVRKARGMATLGGYHQFIITSAGMRVFPRIEAQYACPTSNDVPNGTRIGTGSHGLDAMLGGGLPHASMTLASGPAGCGKTTLGMSFLAAAEKREPALFFGFYETPERLRLKARSLELSLDDKLSAGQLEIIWRPMGENLLDELGHTVVEAVGRRNVKRLVIDSLAGFQRASVSPERLSDFISVLFNQLRGLGITTIATQETAPHRGATDMPTSQFLSVFENLIGVHHLGASAEPRQAVSVMKMRDSAFEPGFRVLEIGRGGLIVGEKIAGAATSQSSPAGAVGSSSW